MVHSAPFFFKRGNKKQMTNIPELFGSLVFNDKAMKERLPDATYRALKKTVETGNTLDPTLAGSIAAVMKDWAIEKGATHYTHWFQPMTGITAEKHDSFITPVSDGTVIMNFSEKELIKGESDASSFPSGGLRSTFEARGYTAWDPSSYAFVKDGALCIPTAFISYGGQTLDKKTPLLRSMNLLNREAKRILSLFGKSVSNVNITVGAEQEYFLVDKSLYLQREDLIFCGRTLFGAKAPKAQELADHYFGNIRPRVLEFMDELDRELWSLGVLAKTRHNEAAPAQHELAPIFTTVNVATDHNQLTMEIMKKVADRHDLVCLLHEKPFAGVNGSGKHNNWSLSTDSGENLLSGGKHPESNLQFLLFLTAMIQAVDEHQDLFRLSVASAANDLRLGAAEAPPAILSVFLGSDLTEIFDSMCGNTVYNVKADSRMRLGGAEVIPAFKMDTADRNRTSPMAFTGNKFEFRMLGSAFNIACPNVMINTSIADALSQFASVLENCNKANFEKTVKELIVSTYSKHKRILFNGNNYSHEWVIEAAKRGLLNLKTTPDALPYYSRDENVALFVKHNIYTRQEIVARQDILLETYSKVINIEAATMLDMANKQILPACYTYMNMLANEIQSKQQLNISSPAELDLLNKINANVQSAYKTAAALNTTLSAIKSDITIGDTTLSVNKPTQISKSATQASNTDKTATATSNTQKSAVEKTALNYRDKILPLMADLRTSCDQLETLVSKSNWCYPTYSDLMFSV